MSAPAVLLEPPPCRGWSAHAEDLARDLWPDIAMWSDSPTAQSLSLAGELVTLRPGVFAPVARLGSMPDRAVALGCALGADLRAAFVIAEASAAWVLLGGRPDDRIALICLARPRSLAGVRMRQAPLPASDVEAIGGCPVTAPGRTVVDLLRFDPRPATIDRARAVVAAGHVEERDVERRLARLRGSPHAHRAAIAWDRVLSSP